MSNNPEFELSGRRHRKAFERWKQRQRGAIRMLVGAVMAELVPAIESQGFHWVDQTLARGEQGTNRADNIAFERRWEKGIDHFSIQFDPRGKTRFTAFARRWSDEELQRHEFWCPHFLLRRPKPAWLGKKFGFSWFDPFVTPLRCAREARELVALIPQVVECLETGKLGSHMTPSMRMSVGPIREKIDTLENAH